MKIDMKFNQRICEDCGTDKTYIRPNGRHDWKKTDTGFRCKKCESKDYVSRHYVPHPKILLTGPCVECDSTYTYIEKSGLAHWYLGRDGTICKKCFNRKNDGKLKPGKCVRCGRDDTKHGWRKTENGKICYWCWNKEYCKIERGGLCKICNVTKSVGWAIHEKYGRICKKCDSKINIRKLKEEIIFHYSRGTMSCNYCGYRENINALVLDHVEGNGTKDRKSKKSQGGWTFYKRLKKLGYPPGLQILCANCNTVKQIEQDQYKNKIKYHV
ncbi:hypothetical protein OAJ88_02605 [Candidatus Nitrosopelagicus sp.]|nr:hypothetical protein [Candidatus Nitrosopelagicus sp.]